VVYDDCFPQHNDVQVGDVAVGLNELYFGGAAGIVSLNQTVTIKSVAPYNFGGRTGVSVVLDTPPQLLPNNSLFYGTESTSAIMRGGRIDTLSQTYLNDAGGVRTITTVTPTAVGDISAGHTLIAYSLGDSVTNTASFTYVDVYSPSQNYQGNVTEKITFIGVEEGTQVIAGKFDYTCVFRHEITGTVNGQSSTSVFDMYHHKWSAIVKTVEFSPSYPRPLIKQLVSDSAIVRRASTP
jgi:hypothetical protein